MTGLSSGKRPYSDDGPRVAIIAELFPTVSETFVLNHVTGLIDLGYAVDVYAFGPEDLKHYGHRQFEDYALSRRTTYLPEEPDQAAVIRQFVDRDYCAIHCHFGMVAEKMAFLRRHLQTTPFLVTFHGKDIRLAEAEGAAVLKSTFETFDRFISICAYNRTRLERLGCPPGRIVDLPNGVNTSVFRPGERPAGGPVRIVTVARLHRTKNLSLAIRVMSRLARAGLDFSYEVLGHGPDRAQLESLVTELELTQRVRLLGQCSQEDVSARLAGTDIFFLPSRAEASPVCVLEAQACAVPVVATRVGGMEDIVLDNVTGHIVDSGDEEAAVNHLLSLARDPEKRRTMGEKGRRRMRGNHESRALIRRCAAMYAVQPVPTVSVIIPTFNREKFLGTAIESVLSQSFQAIELIIIDDGSTDGTRKLVEKYRDQFPGVIRFRQIDRRNAAAARNEGIRLSRGQYIAFLDSDDYWHEEKLVRQFAYLESNPDKGLVHTGIRYVYTDDFVEHDVLPFPTALARSSADCLDGNHIVHMTVLGRTELFLDDGFFDESYLTTHDTELWMRLAAKTEIGVLDEALAFIRCHNDHLSTGDPAQKYQDRLKLTEQQFSGQGSPSAPQIWRKRFNDTRYALGQEKYKSGDHRQAVSLLVKSLSRNPLVGRVRSTPGGSWTDKIMTSLQPYRLVLFSLTRQLLPIPSGGRQKNPGFTDMCRGKDESEKAHADLDSWLSADGHRERLAPFLDRYQDRAFITRKAEEFADSIHQYYDWSGVRLAGGLSWDENPYNDPSWNWQLHVMRSVYFLARGFELCGEIRYLRRAEEMVLDWIDKNMIATDEAPSRYSWDDHSTALRLIHWLYFIEVWKTSDLFRPGPLPLLVQAISAHGTRLADSRFYRPGHNHGIDQDRALLALAFMYPGLQGSDEIIGLCLERLRQQLSSLVSSGGVQLEHSPSYHIIGMVQLMRLSEFLQSWKVENPLVSELDRILDSMTAYLEDIMRPDGKVAPLGDSSVERVSDYRQLLAPLLKSSGILKACVEDGKTAVLADSARLYREEGYLVIRDYDGGRLPFEQSIHLIFTAAANEGRDHGHADLLSFVLHAYGHDILVDHGYYSYRQDPGRDYVTGVASHNTVMVDGESYQGSDRCVDHFVSGPGHCLLRASHRNYAGLEHSRRLLHLRPDLFIVIDQIGPQSGRDSGQSSSREHRFQQLWHLAHDLAAKVRSFSPGRHSVTVSAADGSPVMEIIQFGDSAQPMSVRIARGEERPLMGWTCIEHAKLIPSTTVISSCSGPAAQFVSVLDLSCRRQDWRLDVAAGHHELLKICWQQNGCGHSVELDLACDAMRIGKSASG